MEFVIMPNVDLTVVEIVMLKRCIKTALDTIQFSEEEKNKGLLLRRKLESYL
jgi:hypothetical protein